MIETDSLIKINFDLFFLIVGIRLYISQDIKRTTASNKNALTF